VRGSTLAVTFLPFTVMETGADIDDSPLVAGGAPGSSALADRRNPNSARCFSAECRRAARLGQGRSDDNREVCGAVFGPLPIGAQASETRAAAQRAGVSP